MAIAIENRANISFHYQEYSFLLDRQMWTIAYSAVYVRFEALLD
ncbi:MAG TPA: hypothetical protein V6D09_25300 [Leptolyngbyaceae cyanobacterium]